VNCYRCVAVCPTGIDIRRGIQMECIACTSCADACDAVMEKMGKPKGLIRYKSYLGDLGTVSPLRPRALIYALLVTLVGGGLAFNISRHKSLSAEFVRALEIPYQIAPGADGAELVTNHFKLDLRNQDFEATRVELSLSPASKKVGFEMIAIQPVIELAAGENRRVDVFFRFPKRALSGGTARTRVVLSSREKIEQEVKLVGPLN